MTQPELDPQLVSVAIPTYRRPLELRRACRSALNQTYRRLEVVISLEAKDEASLDVARDLARQDPRVSFTINRDPPGQVANTNAAIGACSGSWIKLLHDDDWMLPHAIETMLAATTLSPDAIAVACSVNSIFPRYVLNRSAARHSPPVLLDSQEALRDLYLQRLTRAIGIVPSGLLIKASDMQQGPLMRHEARVAHGVDQLLFLDLAKQGSLVILAEGLVFYNASTPESETTKASAEAVDKETYFLKQLNWTLLQDKAGLPEPDVLVACLRLARIPRRILQQSVMKTCRDLMHVLRPAVLRHAAEAFRVHQALAVFTGLRQIRRRRTLFVQQTHSDA